MKATWGEVAFWAFWIMVFMTLAYWTGVTVTHQDLLAQCKGPEHGIRLHVDGKQYFYYCSYTPQ